MRENADQQIRVVLVGTPPETAVALKTELDALHLNTQLVVDIHAGQRLVEASQAIFALAWWIPRLTQQVIAQVQTIQRLPVPISLCDLMLITRDTMPTQLQLTGTAYSGGLKTLRWNLAPERLLAEIRRACRQAERRHARRAGLVDLLQRLSSFQHAFESVRSYRPDSMTMTQSTKVSEPTMTTPAHAVPTQSLEEQQTREEGLRQAHFGTSLKLESSWLILLLIAKASRTPVGCTPATIREQTGLNAETVSRRLAKLERAGLVQRSKAHGQPEASGLALTQLAQERLVQLGALAPDPD